MAALGQWGGRGMDHEITVARRDLTTNQRASGGRVVRGEDDDRGAAPRGERPGSGRERHEVVGAIEIKDVPGVDGPGPGDRLTSSGSLCGMVGVARLVVPLADGTTDMRDCRTIRSIIPSEKV